MNRRLRQHGGFTLLELLAATAMTAVLAGSLYATLHAAFRARDSASGAVEQMRRAEMAVELIRTDIESAAVPRGILAGLFLGEDVADGSGGASDALQLYSMADGTQSAEGVGDVRMVEIECRTDEDSGQLVLVRRVTTNLLTTSVQEPDEEILCRGVRSFDLRYHNGLEWQDNWDSGVEDNSLPPAVEVTLQLVGEHGRATDEQEGGYWVSRVFRISCSTITAGQQVEMGL
jgi:general secretion pathway protein J